MWPLFLYLNPQNRAKFRLDLQSDNNKSIGLIIVRLCPHPLPEAKPLDRALEPLSPTHLTSFAPSNHDYTPAGSATSINQRLSVDE